MVSFTTEQPHQSVVKAEQLCQTWQQTQHHTPSMELHTATAANNFQLTFIQPMHLLVIHFGLAHRLLSPSFVHLCINLHAQH